MSENALHLRVQGKPVRVEGRSAVIGRSKSCDVHIEHQGISRRHCEVLLREDGVSVRDLGSTHGTFLDGRRIRGEERLRPGVRVTLGPRGPQFELLDGIAGGRSVLGPPGENERTGTSVHEEPPEPSMAERTAPVPPIELEPAAAVAPPRSRFVAGLAIGVLAGVIAGVVSMAVVDLRF